MFTDKVIFRKKCKKKLQKSSKIAKLYKDKMITKKLENIINIFKFRNILLYIPMGFEADITAFTKNMRKNHNIFVPFMEGISFKIVKYRLPLRKKKFSIKEPNNSFLKCRRVDVAIVPVLGVGRNYKRVGFGKGMYDRFFANLDYRPIIIFVQIEKCYDKKVATDTFDIQSDFYITPKKIYITRGKEYVDKYLHSHSKFTYRRSCWSFATKKVRGIKI